MIEASTVLSAVAAVLTVGVVVSYVPWGYLARWARWRAARPTMAPHETLLSRRYRWLAARPQRGKL